MRSVIYWSLMFMNEYVEAKEAEIILYRMYKAKVKEMINNRN